MAGLKSANRSEERLGIDRIDTEGNALVDVRNLAVVAGNGLSVAFSNDLVLGTITEKLKNELSAIAPNGDQVLQALAKIAGRIEDDGSFDEGDFEQLVGAFESQAALLEDLADLTGLAGEGNTSLQASLLEVRGFAGDLLKKGTGIILKTILDSAPTGWDATAHMHPFFRQICHEYSGDITFANLNYDSLVLSCLAMLGLPFCDLADPRRPAQIKFTDDEAGEVKVVGEYEGWSLRDALDFPFNKRIRLVHPHGSLTFWKDMNTGEVVKIPLNALRTHNIFTDLDVNSKNMIPAVVLANSREKPRRVKEYPFDLAYKAMAHGLSTSDHWLIVGYSFRDESVNIELRNALSRKTVKPKILISTFGDELTEEMVKDSIGWGTEHGPSVQNIYFDREGVEGLEQRPSWKIFTSS
ncbi:hypothetical protein ACFY5D_16730 [Paeniglutamicibacter sp. NPDC012692]|uniref:hypothetical protein n=1 Tax=Paeniglutamicibacter sp. NPDC012692 TaxID=3364388 RepID=UPI00367556CA